MTERDFRALGLAGVSHHRNLCDRGHAWRYRAGAAALGV
jgi:hypothetical protein